VAFYLSFSHTRAGDDNRRNEIYILVFKQEPVLQKGRGLCAKPIRFMKPNRFTTNRIMDCILFCRLNNVEKRKSYLNKGVKPQKRKGKKTLEG